MKKITGFITAVVLVTSITTLQAQSSDKLELFFKLSDYFLKRHVYNGLVNYQYSSKNSAEIELLHQTAKEIDLSKATPSEKKAFYINAYNILVIYQVTKAYPLARPLDKEGFFDKISYSIAGEQLTLNELESKRILEDNDNDPRFHFVLACAAISCPRLYNLAYKPENVDELMDERTNLALNDDSFIYLDKQSKTVMVSKIFEWYMSDFNRNGDNIIDFINKYRIEKVPSNYKVDYYEYDWTLNERKS